MKTDARTPRKLSRRSFLACVIGGAAVSGALATPPAQAPASRRMVVDSDPSDPARPEPTVDTDTGSNSDRPGLGRSRTGAVRPAPRAEPPPAPSAAIPPPPPPTPGGPRSSFVICPGHPRCPK
jgi:hypothetical protein